MKDFFFFFNVIDIIQVVLKAAVFAETTRLPLRQQHFQAFIHWDPKAFPSQYVPVFPSLIRNCLASRSIRNMLKPPQSECAALSFKLFLSDLALYTMSLRVRPATLPNKPLVLYPQFCSFGH